MKFKFTKEALRKPTPEKMRLLGNTIMVIGVAIGSSVYALQYEWVGITAFILGLVGKG